MDLFEYNMIYLKKDYPNIYNEINSINMDFSEFAVQEFQNSLYNVLYLEENGNKNYLYEEEEFEKQILSINEASKKYRFYIGMGFGLGYLYLPLVKEKFVKEIIIIEPDVRLFLIYLHLYRVDELLGSGKVILILGGDRENWTKDIVTKYKHFLDHEVKFIIADYYKQKYKENFLGFITDFQKHYISSISNRYTIDIFNNKYIKNTLKNTFNQIPKSSSADSLYNKYKDYPAIIVGAGPSLNKQIELLKELQGKAIIFAVGSAINVLEYHEITPTFRVAIDTSETEASYFKKLDDKSVDLIYFSILNAKSFDGYKGNLYYSTSYVTREIVSYLEEKLTLNVQPVLGGGSVSVFSADIASRMGCSPILLIGQDFAFPHLNSYAKGAVSEKKMNIEEDKLIKKKDIYGNDTYTRQNMYSLKLAFDNYIKESDNNRVINCTEGGLGIENVPNEKFKDMAEKYCKRKLKIDKIVNIYDNKDKIIDLYEDIIKQTEEFELIFGSINTILDSIQDVIEMETEQNNNSLCQLSEELKEQQAILDNTELYCKWLLPNCEYKLESIDIEYQKEDYLKDTQYEKQKMYIKYMKKQYDVLQKMNKFINETVNEIIICD